MNHRPTLEGKRGYEKSIRDTIQHARLLKGHTKLKYRLDVTVGDDASRKRLRLGPETEGAEGAEDKEGAEGKGETRSNFLSLGAGQQLAVLAKASNTGAELDHLESEKLQQLKTNGLNQPDSDHLAESSNSQTSDSSEAETDLDSESDAALMAELDKLRKDRQQRDPDVSIKPNLESKPLPTEPPKRSWRSSRPFAKKASNSEKQYTADTLNSGTHKQFMNKYIR